MEAVMTCQGHIADPQFSVTLKKLVGELRKLVRGGIKVRKVEPWNSVRVTFSLGAEAAERLRLLATEDGGQILARLGILSVQVRSSELIVIRTGGGSAVGVPGQVRRDNEAGPSHRGQQQLPQQQQPLQMPPQQQHQLAVASGSQMIPGPVRPPQAPPPPYPGPGPMLVNLLQQQQQPPLIPEDPSPLPVQPAPQPVLHYRLPQQQQQQQQPLPPQPNPSLSHQPSSSNSSLPSSSSNSSDVTSSGKTRQYLINPLTGVLEPMSSESSDDDEPVPPIMHSPTPPTSPLPPLPSHPHTNQPQAPSPTLCRLIQEDNNKPPPMSTAVISNSTVPQTNFHPPPTPQSVTTASSSVSPLEETAQQRAVDKLKLRLKLEKTSSGPFLYAPAAATTSSSPSSSTLTATLSNNLQQSTTTVPPTAEPRVPPLHISLRGRNAAVVTRFRDRKREGKTRKKVDSPPLERDNSSLRDLASVPPVPQPPPIPPQVSSYPSEAEVASILRSVPEVTTDEKKRKRSHPKSLTTPLRPQLEDKRRKVANSTAAVSSGASHQMNSSNSSGSFVKSLIKVLAKESSRVVVPPPSSNNSGGNGGSVQQQISIVQPTVNDKKGDENDLCSVKGMPTKKESPFVSKPSPPTPLPAVVHAPANSAPPPLNPPTSVTAQPATTPCEAVKPVNDKAGEDSGIESMDALSEKSPNRGEEEGSGTGSDGSSVGNKKNGSREGDAIIDGVVEPGRTGNDLTEPDDPMPVRLTPALYTYSNPDKIKDGSVSGGSPLREDSNERPPSMPMPRSTSRSRSNSASTPPSSTGAKSLLEQLLIEIPSANSSSERGDMKNLNGPKSLSSKSLRLEDLTMNTSTGTPTPSPLVKHHRPRKPSESSSSSSPAILDDSTTPPLSTSSVSSNSSTTSSTVNNITTRSKRKCSENASELIKACMGVNAIDSTVGGLGVGAGGPAASVTAPGLVNPTINNNNNSIQIASPVTPTSQAPPIPVDDPAKMKKLTPSKTESSEDEDNKSGKDEDKNSKIVGRRSARQEVKRTIHRKRQRIEEIVESKGRRRSSKEAK